MALPGDQAQQLSEALRTAFTRQRLKELLYFRLDKDIADYDQGGDYRQLAFDLLRSADQEGWLGDLVNAATASNPRNPDLQRAATLLGLTSLRGDAANAERIISATANFIDLDAWLVHLAAIERRVGRVEVPLQEGIAYGTGFLVAPDLVLTNYHVVDFAVDTGRRRAESLPWADPSKIVVRFDYKRLADGKTVNPGSPVSLADDWLLDSSPMSPSDDEVDPKTSLPSLDELDYALIQLSQPVGSRPVGESPEATAPARGWISLPKAVAPPPAHAPLAIVQHPAGDPVQLAIEMDGVIAINENGTRVRYRTNTLGGSSGSPCFDLDLDLVALHHAGDPNFQAGHRPDYNEGVPIVPIRDRLNRNGFGGRLT